jgi:hypothetical protein
MLLNIMLLKRRPRPKTKIRPIDGSLAGFLLRQSIVIFYSLCVVFLIVFPLDHSISSPPCDWAVCSYP